jgi:uncharacterized protein YjbI with pentapeptide repeats
MSKRKLPKIPKKKILLGLGVVLVMAAVWRFHHQIWPGGLGIDKEQSVTTRSVETVVKDAQGNTTKTVETTKIDDGKTLWDWLSLLGVPVSLAVLGYVLQQLQQKRAEVLAKEQRQIAADETKEEVLQVYFDRLSGLLIDKNLLAIAAKGQYASDQEQQLLDSSKDVVRARTLSILRRFGNDPERKTSVTRFLIEADFISKLKLNLNGADLSGVKILGATLSKANLRGSNLSGADLTHVELTNAQLNGAKLSSATLNEAILDNVNLISADLRDAELNGASLNGAKLNNAKLNNAKLFDTDLRGAVGLTVAQLQSAKLCHTQLPKNITQDPDCPNPDGDCETV